MTDTTLNWGRKPNFRRFEPDALNQALQKTAALVHFRKDNPATAPQLAREQAAPARPAAAASHIIAIGASTGGPEALGTVLAGLPAQMPGIVAVQHMPEGAFIKMLAQRLDSLLPLNVREAEDNVLILPNSVHIGPTGWHLTVEKRGGGYYTRLKPDDKSHVHCPSADHLFRSLAASAGQNATGVILTGMGADGAEGLLAMRKAGAYTIGQDEASSIVYGMPKKAFELGAVCVQAPLKEIPQRLIMHLMNIK